LLYLIIANRPDFDICPTPAKHQIVDPISKFRESVAGFESDRNARERRSRSFLYNGNVVPVVFLYTPIVNCNFPWKSFGYKADSLASCCRSAKFYYGPYATNVFIKINMPSAESDFSEIKLNLLK